ncbi:MAG TPA: YihY/virulence factor BrkB family protein [Baekduia sp.]|nr:YihY/virulence factor BrkB family protein [Baekduia sp.]
MSLEHDDERATVRAKRVRKGAAGSPPDSPMKLGGRAKKDALKRTVKEFQADNLTDWAAALTYYGVMALFPALIALVAVLGLIGASATQPLLDNLALVSPGPARDILTSTIQNLTENQGSAGIAFVIGLLVALNAASGYIGAFTRASNSIYEVAEGRPIWKLKPFQLALTCVLLVLLVLTIGAVAISGPLAEEAGKLVGLGSSAVLVWDVAKIPVLLAIVAFMIAFLYWAAPNVKQPGFKFITPGGVVALVLWVVASLLFALYVATFASYDKTYGALGGAVVFLVWLWISNLAILFGAEFNAELQRSQQREAGHDAPLDEPFLEPRDTSKLEKS